jgi:hypothetical protein
MDPSVKLRELSELRLHKALAVPPKDYKAMAQALLYNADEEKAVVMRAINEQRMVCLFRSSK